MEAAELKQMNSRNLKYRGRCSQHSDKNYGLGEYRGIDVNFHVPDKEMWVNGGTIIKSRLKKK